jgi:hypothetical protein
VGLSLVGIVLGSTGVRILAAIQTSAPWILPDELVYSHLARSFAATGHFAVRGEAFPPWSFGPLYPILIAPIFAVSSMATAYAAVKLVNCVLFSLAAVPAYFLARKVMGKRLALIVAALTVFVPSAVYTSKIMTESLAYPLFLTAVLAIVRALEVRSWRREVAAILMIALAALARGQLIVLFPAFLATLVIVASGDERDAAGRLGLHGVVARVAAYRLTWLALFLGLCATAAATFGGLSEEIAGGHGEAFAATDVSALARSFLNHVVELDLYLGAVPVAATAFVGVVAFRRGSNERLLRALCALGLTTTLFLAASAARYLVAVEGATGDHIPVFDRYLFYAAPLILITFLAWFERGMPRPRATVATALVVAAAPLALPYAALLDGRQWGTNSSTVGLVPWAALRTATGSLLAVYFVLIAGGAWLAYLTARATRPRWVLVVVAGNFMIANFLAQAGNAALSHRAVRLGLGGTATPSWIDTATPAGAEVSAVWSGSGELAWKRWFTIWENEFFNQKVRDVYVLREPMRYDLPQVRLTRRGSAVLLPDGRPFVAPYVLIDAATPVAGTLVAEDPDSGMALFKVDGRVLLRSGPRVRPEPTRP